ncbi:Protein CSN12 [Rhodotorula toruloides]|nr:Protein CSN12 [Rhodotorula toruloides]
MQQKEDERAKESGRRALPLLDPVLIAVFASCGCWEASETVMPTLHISSYAGQIDQAAKFRDGRTLASLLSLSGKHGQMVLDFLAKPDRGTAWIDRTLDTPNPSYAGQFKRTISKDGPWAEMATGHIWALVALNPVMNPMTHQMHHSDAVVAYQKQHEVVTALYRYLMDARDQTTGWALPLLYVVCRDLRKVAEQADQQLLANSQKAVKLEEASRLLQKCFSCCLNDRASDIAASRKMGTYYLATLLFKTYFRLNSTALCKNIIRGIGAADLPPLSSFPRAHQVTYKYYMAVFAFLREDYADAENRFREALEMCHYRMKRNIELILDYLIPLLLLRGVFPSSKLLAKSARHKTLYGPFAQAIKTGNVAAYERQLERAEKRLMERGTYLVVERARENAVRGLLKRAWVLEGKPARLSVETFRRYYNAAYAVGLLDSGLSAADIERVRKSAEIDSEEMECLLANMIYKGLLKGYISHAHQLVVLSKDKPFPWYSPYRNRGQAFMQARQEKENSERQKMPPSTDGAAAQNDLPGMPSLAPLSASAGPSSASALPPPPGATSSNGVVLPGNGDLWSSILDSVKGTKNVQTKQCFVLGSRNSGKSTLVSRLRMTTGEAPPSSSTSAGKGRDDGEKPLDLGMSYEVLDVREEGDEGDTVARLGFFHVPAPSPPYPALLSLALSRSNLLDSLVVLVLDWEKPWNFVRELEAWLALLEDQLKRARRGEKEKEAYEEVEARERLEAYVRSYQEPTSSGAAPSTSAAAHLDDSPLPPGTLLDNLGIGLVIVCTKADQMNMLERDREFTEEQFDYIQQLLRTVALRYGAAVFYTSQTLPSSYAKLRQYILHRLFAAPASTALATNASANPTTPTSSSRPAAPAPIATSARASFPFPHRANVVDRDQVLVPAGWDSWGKIKIMRERFDCEQAGEGWEADLERLRAGASGAETDVSGEEGNRGLRREYEMVVVDFEAEDRPTNASTTVAPADEQSFLRQHYEVLQAEAAKDPRLAFRQPTSTGSVSSTLGPSVVGPMAGASLDLPTVASTLERARDRGDTAAAAGRDGARPDERYFTSMSRQNSGTSTSARSPPLSSSATFGSSSASSTSALLGRSLSKEAAAGSPSAAAGGTSSTAGAAAGGNQVLADFFQSLLTARTAGAGGATGAAGSAGGLRASTRGASPGGSAEEAKSQRGTGALWFSSSSFVHGVHFVSVEAVARPAQRPVQACKRPDGVTAFSSRGGLQQSAG